MARKILKYKVNLRSTLVERNNPIPKVFTNDKHSVAIEFEITDLQPMELVGAEASVLLFMKDGSFFQNGNEDVTLSGNTLTYILKENEGQHAGLVEVQLVVTLEGKEYATQLYKFEIMPGLGNKAVTEVMVNDWNKLTKEARTYLDALELSTEQVRTLTAEGFIELKMDEKLQELESTYANRLLSTEQQLTQTDLAVSSRVKMTKEVEGGQFPKPLRVPTLAVEEVFPNERSPFTPLWAMGQEIYAFGQDNLIRKSTDGGVTWDRRGYFLFGGLAAFDSFLKLKTGTLLTVISSRHIVRSTNDAGSWDSVFQFRSGAQPLGAQSWAVDEKNGHIYIGEYIGGSETANLYRSTDDGQSWDLFYSFPGQLSPPGTDGKITHLHAVQYDPYSERVYICAGDSSPDTGLWRVNAQGSGVERVVTNSMLPSGMFDAPRTIGIMFFSDYLAWASDSTSNPWIFRMARSEIGNPKPEVERIYRVNSTAWWSCRAGEDGNRWIVSASQENANHAIDNMVHLYCVEDQGSTVWEVGMVPAATNGNVGSIQPLGTPYQKGEQFYMTTRLARKKTTWRLRLGSGTTELRTADPISDVRVTHTQSGGIMEIKPNEEKIFAIARAGGIGRRFHLYDFGVGGLSDTGGNVAISIRRKGETNSIFSTSQDSQRYTNRAEMGTYMDRYLTSAGERLEFVVKNVHQGNTYSVNPFVTYGWGV